jgi:hypothetical protein
MPRRRVELTRNFVLDHDYWLCRCDGFRVEADGRKLGVVAELRFRTRHDRPDALVVYGGVLGNRVLVVPAGDVAGVVPREERVVLAAVPERLRARDRGRLRSRVSTAAHRAAHVLQAVPH